MRACERDLGSFLGQLFKSREQPRGRSAVSDLRAWYVLPNRWDLVRRERLGDSVAVFAGLREDSGEIDG